MGCTDNQLSGNIPDFSNLTALRDLELYNNQFTFSNIIFTKNSIDNLISDNATQSWQEYSYAPQDFFFIDTLIQAAMNETLTIDLGIDEGLESNQYQWFKNGETWKNIPGNNDLVFDNFQLQDTGVYHVQVTNPNAPDLTLYSRPITIKAASLPCPDLNPPMALEQNLTYCEGAALPVLTVEVVANETVHWYDQPTGGQLLFVGNDFQPNGPGLFYAEGVLQENERCTSNGRTPITVTETLSPTIGLNRQQDCYDFGYIASLTIERADSVWTNADSTIQNGNVYAFIYWDAESELVVEAFNGACAQVFTLPPPNCACPSLDLSPPEKVVGTVSYCPTDFGDITPLVAQSSEGIIIRWYAKPLGGLPLAENTTEFIPPQQGIYYAEAYDPVLRCRSNERTAFTVFEQDAPFIREYDRFCNPDGQTYTVILNIERDDALLNSLGTLSRGAENTDTIKDIPLDQEVQVIAINQNTLCETKFAAVAPECECSGVLPPTAPERIFTYCAGASIPTLNVGIPPGAIVNWYDAPDGGRLLLSGPSTFQPSGPGDYYAETFVPAENCASRERIGLEVVLLPASTIIFSETTCKISELRADTTFFENSVGCDSLIITAFNLSAPKVQMEQIEVCTAEEIGFDTLINVGQDGCTVLLVQEKILADIEGRIELTPDEYRVNPSERLEFIDLLENDVIPEPYFFRPLTIPTIGQFSFEEKDGFQTGEISFTAPSIPQQVSFDYVVCDLSCPDTFCDTTSATFNVNCEAELTSAFVEVITPNGDGQNDVFDPLEAFLDSECPIDLQSLDFIIFNQRGDLLYRSKNREGLKWSGLDLLGNELPKGTYYFQLRVNGRKKPYTGFIDLIRKKN